MTRRNTPIGDCNIRARRLSGFRWWAVAALVILLSTPLAPVAHAQNPDVSAAGVADASDNSALELAGRKIERIQFRGNRRIEDEAIRGVLLSKVGAPLDPARLRDDVKAMWRLGPFSDVVVEAEVAASGAVVLTYAVKEKPTVRKVVIAGNDEIELEDLNKALAEAGANRLELDAVIDIGKVKGSRDALVAAYVAKGFYLAGVDFEIRQANDAEVDVWYTVREGRKVEIRDVQFVGNSAIRDDELRAYIGTRRKGALSFLDESGTFRQEQFDRDLMIISAFYWDRGYANVKVGTPQIRLSRDKSYMYVAIPIDEGPIFTYGKIDFKGDLIGTAADHLKKIAARPGERFARSTIANDREALSAFYMDQGYAYANVSPATKVDLDKREIGLTYEVSRGKKAFFERIIIRGNSKTRDKVIRREMKIAEGELFNNSNLEISKRRITALGFFKCPDADREPVSISTKRGSSDEFVEVNVEVCETSTGTFQIGAGFSSVENFIAQAQVSQNNLFGRGQTLALQAQLSSLRQLFLLRFVEPYFLDTNWTFAFDLYNQARGFGTFSRNSSGGSLTWGYPLSYEARAFVTYKLEDVSISTGSSGFVNIGATRAPIAAQSVANLFRGGVTSSVRSSIQWDSRNNRLLATDGWFLTAFAEYAGAATASENRFIRWGGFARHYRRLWGPFVLRLNSEVGVTTSTNALGVPISERYLVGGIFDIRGFAPRSLGPRIATSSPGDVGQPLGSLPLGGNLQFIWNSEIEFPLFKRIGISGVVFYDMGNAYNLEDRYCSGLQRKTSLVSIKFDPCFRFPESVTTGLRKSVGFGFRWQSPIGPLRFEWGIPLDRQAALNEDSLVFEFTIGNFF